MVQRPETHLAGDLASTPAAQKEYELLKILAEHYFGSMLVTDDRGRFLYVSDGIRFMQGTDKTPSMIIAESDAMVKLLEYADHVAAVDSTVILYGESGSGKEMFAKYIHARSDRADQVFIPINCASLPPSLLEEEMFGYERGTFTGGSKDGRIGLFEFADKGTIFLDEIGEMPLELQAKLLRIIETGEVKRLGSNRIQKCDVRIIAATNRNLREMVEERHSGQTCITD